MWWSSNQWNSLGGIKSSKKYKIYESLKHVLRDKTWKKENHNANLNKLCLICVPPPDAWVTPHSAVWRHVVFFLCCFSCSSWQPLVSIGWNSSNPWNTPEQWRESENVTRVPDCNCVLPTRLWKTCKIPLSLNAVFSFSGYYIKVFRVTRWSWLPGLSGAASLGFWTIKIWMSCSHFQQSNPDLLERRVIIPQLWKTDVLLKTCLGVAAAMLTCCQVRKFTGSAGAGRQQTADSRGLERSGSDTALICTHA